MTYNKMINKHNMIKIFLLRWVNEHYHKGSINIQIVLTDLRQQQGSIVLQYIEEIRIVT